MKPEPSSPRDQGFSKEDADELVKSYGRPIEGRKKAGIMSKLRAERGNVEKGVTEQEGPEKTPEIERER